MQATNNLRKHDDNFEGDNNGLYIKILNNNPYCI